MGFFQKLKDLKNYSEKIAQYEQQVHELEEKIETANKEAEKAERNRDDQLAMTASEQERIIENYSSERAEAQIKHDEICRQLEEKAAELEKQNQVRIKNDAKARLYRSMVLNLNKELSAGDSLSGDVRIKLETLAPTVEIHFHSFDIKSLRELSKENEKLINLTLKRYEKRYTTKSNRAIYQLMVLALRAELQNILTDLKFGTLEKCKNNLNSLIEKYLDIASDGNQTIAPSLNAFIGEMKGLFEKSIDIEYEYYSKREQERQEQLALREQMRQEAEERKALEAERAKVEKEELKYSNAIATVEAQISECTDDEMLKALQEKIEELQKQLKAVEDKKEDIISRQNGKAGCVYVISNLGSFGENTFKVGMTRRLDPMDRVRELGDASVPFAFDVHSFIFTQDAVTLEQELHNRLNDRRKNKVNYRKEFFDIPLDEIEAIVHEVDPTAEFNRTMVALEYRQGLELG